MSDTRKVDMEQNEEVKTSREDAERPYLEINFNEHLALNYLYTYKFQYSITLFVPIYIHKKNKNKILRGLLRGNVTNCPT